MRPEGCMSADLDFLDAILRGLDDSDLDWAETRIKRIKESRNEPELKRKTIIRKS